ncbi:MAG: CBS domain-containing protein [Polyangiales bacterium]
MNVEQRTAADLMTRNLLTVARTETLRAAVKTMHAHHVHCLLVPHDDARRCVGIVTAKDIIQILCEGDSEMLDRLRVADAMTETSVSLQSDFVIADCLRLMRRSGVRSAPVMQGSRLVGLLSFTDVLRALAEG